MTKDNRKNAEYHVVVAIRRLRTDKNCPAATRILFCGFGLKLFSKRYQFLPNTSPVIFFQLNALKGTTKAPAVELLRLCALIETKKYQTAKRYYDHPSPFPLPPGGMQILGWIVVVRENFSANKRLCRK